MGLNAWQSEIIKVFIYLSFSRKRPFCNWTKFRRRNARNRIGEFSTIIHFHVIKTRRCVKDNNLGVQFLTELMQILWLFALSSDWLLLQLSLSTVERQFICACSVNLDRLMPETAGMRLCRFVSEEMKEHRTENNNWLSIWNNLSWDNLSCHLFLCNLDGGVKVLKLLCGVWKEVIF